MAAAIKFSDLTENQVRLIQLALTIQPLDPEAEKRKLYKSAATKNAKVAPPIGFFKVISGPKKEPSDSSKVAIADPKDAVVMVPFRFACGLLGKMANRDRSYPKVVDVGYDRPHFVAKLLDNQVPIAQELYQQLATYGTTTAGLPPGWGKTMVGIWLWHMTATVLCIYVTREILVTSWMTTIKKAVPGMVDRTWIVGEKNIPKEIAIIICMNERYHHVPEHIRASVGCLIVDEAHLFFTPGNVEPLLYFTPKFVILETATLYRDDGMERMGYAMAGEHGVLRKPDKQYTLLALSTLMCVPEEKNSFGNDFGAMTEKLCKLPERNRIILDIVYTNPHRKFMILTRRADHVGYLADCFTQMGIRCATLFGTQKSYFDSPVLIGTMSKIGTGFDEANFCPDYNGRGSDTLILCSSIKKYQSFEQQKGRIRASNGIVICLVDNNAASKRHLKDMIPWITKTSGTVSEMVYSGDGCVRLPQLPESSSAKATATPATAASAATPVTATTPVTGVTTTSILNIINTDTNQNVANSPATVAAPVFTIYGPSTATSTK